MGANGNIGNSWKAASELMGFELEQCCPIGYELDNIKFHTNIDDAILNPCPPFFRGEEVSENVINSDYFVGYAFKKDLVTVQKAILCYLLDRK